MVRELDKLIAPGRLAEKLVQAVFLCVAKKKKARSAPCDGCDKGIVVVVAVVDVGRVGDNEAVFGFDPVVLRQTEKRRIPILRGALEQRKIHRLFFVGRTENLSHRVGAHKRRRRADVVLIVMAEDEIVDALHAAAIERGADGVKIVLIGGIVHDGDAVHTDDDAVGFSAVENVQRKNAVFRSGHGGSACAERKQRTERKQRGKASFHGSASPFAGGTIPVLLFAFIAV